MEHKPITNTQDVINSKELLTRINWLEQQLNYRCSDDYSEELKALNAFSRNIEAAASVSTYDDGVNLVRDSVFEDHANGTITERTGKALCREDCRPVDFGGVIYWLPR
ncbi:MAG TPA: hypothetical protein VHB01_06345 [Nitrosospira sp.]|jgi:hypothetical protein|nr:hypothetical protein [Nitrosospira sp.]